MQRPSTGKALPTKKRSKFPPIPSSTSMNSSSASRSKSISKSNSKSDAPTTDRSSKSSSSTSSAKPEVISLIEMEENQVKEAMKRSIRDAFSPPLSTSSKKQKAEVICLIDSDDDDDLKNDGGGKMSRCSSISTINLLDSGTTTTCDNGKSKIKRSDDDDDDDDDEIMIVDGPDALQTSFHSASATALASSGNGENDDEIMELGIKNGMDLVHMRQHCTKHAFVQDAKKKPFFEQNAAIEKNKHFCDKCYCYICDVPASECKRWDFHCNASDKGVDAALWKNMRMKAKDGIVTSEYDSSNGNEDGDESSNSGDGFRNAFERLLAHRIGFLPFLDYDVGPDDSDEGEPVMFGFDPNPFRVFGEEFCQPGPFEPNKVQPSTPLASRLTQCRKCKWWNKVNKNRCIGFNDWCQACGRVMSESDFNKEQKSSAFKPQVGEYKLGEKVIPFRIKARDPRKIKPYDAKWKDLEGQEGWIYDEAEMKSDFYHHRIGKKPSLQNLLYSISVFEEDKIPEKGAVELCPSRTRNVVTKGYSGLETEALIIDNRNHRIILQQLYQIQKRIIGSPIRCKIETKWDDTSQTGSILPTVLLTKEAMHVTSNKGNSLSYLIGAWYDIFPLKLSELTNGLPFNGQKTRSDKSILAQETGLPYSLNKTEIKRLAKTFDDSDAKETLKKYENEANEISNKFSFLASSGKKHNGGICVNDNSLKGTLTKFFREALIENLTITHDLPICNFGPTPAGQKLGIQSTHRETMTPCHTSKDMFLSDSDPCSVNAILEPKEVFVLQQYLRPQLKQISSDVSTINGLMMHLENLQHDPVDHVEGLNVELFDFQREAVGWALEREKMTGGVQSALWTKVSAREYFRPNQVRHGPNRSRLVDLYYSPVLDMFSNEKPEEVKGGIIAEQMGLGKTVISLALILTNPAPPTPQSASLVKDFIAPDTDMPASIVSLWPERRPIDDVSPKRRAQYFCRGTLVVCNVSLVGQWIDEAKSKLKDPGLVYSYHGGGRKRCPVTLANNAIVVTTYATLASDSNYWRKKSNDPNYCPPCEQIWWWRIICDESHALKDQNTHHSRALNSIKGVNKWCVTGTPMNTSVKDLKGQLSFLGIQNIPAYFSVFSDKMKSHFNKSTRYSSCDDKTVEFLFMMRNIMIRHSIQMKSRAEERSIMTLPPKTEKVIKISFNKAEREAYLKLERTARAVYEGIKAQGTSLISKNYLKISSALQPLRIACSGGEPDECVTNPKHKAAGKKASSKSIDISIDNYHSECPICLDQIDNARATSCKPIPHVFCKDCIEGYFDGEQSIDCPSCRSKVKLRELYSVNIIDPNSATEDLPSKSNASKKAKKSKLIKDLIFKSKFEHLVVELKRIRDTEPQSKSLVFSQFFSTLQWMKQELPKHGFQFRTLSGDMPMTKRAKALRDFQQDPPTTIFLLSMRSGAVGINLTQANRVFLMEPAMNPALEAQAVGRVYRLGQRKSVQVIRMCIKDSVETRLMEMLAKKYGEAGKLAPEKEKDDENTGNEINSEGQIDTTSAKTATPAVGHMNTDKAALLATEFDLLFNV